MCCVFCQPCQGHVFTFIVHVLQALAAHLLNLWDKTLLFQSCAAKSGCSIPRQLLLLLGIRGSCRLSMPVLKENLSRVLRGAGGTGAGLGTTIHLSSSEEVPDNDSEAVSARSTHPPRTPVCNRHKSATDTALLGSRAHMHAGMCYKLDARISANRSCACTSAQLRACRHVPP